MGLVREVDAILGQFRDVFHRQATFYWFVILIWAFMIRMEAFGITSVIRCFALAPSEYLNLLHFFRSTAFQLTLVCARWAAIVQRYTQPIVVEGLPTYVCDGIKVGKAGHKMPGVKLLYQESTDNTKPTYIMGHFWGAVSTLAAAGRHVFAIPLRFQIQDGLKRSPSEKASLVDKMAALVTQTVPPKALVVVDAYYCAKGFLEALRAARLQCIGRIRSTTVAYQPFVRPPGPRPRGRPRIRGARVKLKELFRQTTRFQTASVSLYGDLKEIRYLCHDLIWQGLLVRFVLTIYPDGTQRILLSTNTTLCPESIIHAYGLRFKIEVSFKTLVQTLCAFSYHFWLKAMPKSRRGDGNQYLHRCTQDYRQQVWRKLDAYERFVNLCAIALGILQILAIRFPNHVWQHFPLWLRTLPKHGCPSENVVRLTLQHELHQISLTSTQDTLLHQILSQRKRAPPDTSHPLQLAA